MTSHAPRITESASLRLAAIDVGSNSIHMVVAQIDPDGAVTTLWRLKEPVGLGRQTFPARRLSEEAMDRAVATLGRLKQAAESRRATKVLATATSAVREADNGGDLIERVRRDVKLRVRVINGREEARLIFLGVRHSLPMGDTKHLVMDIGGGSVEFIIGDGAKVHLAESRKLGAGRMTSTFVNSDPISEDDQAALLAHYDKLLTPLVEKLQATGFEVAVGTSGTLTNIAELCGCELTTDDPTNAVGVIHADKLDRLAKKLLKSTSDERGQLPGLAEHRRDQITAGVLLTRELMRRLGLERIVIVGTALREGLLVDYVEKRRPDLEVRREVPDPRRRSVLDLCRKCDWHRVHSLQVARVTLRLFDELRPLHGLGVAERELIEYAALMHDIGWHIGKKKHHKHSQYLITHGRLKGFTDDEVDVMAAIARYHRRALPKEKHEPYGGMSKDRRRLVEVGASLLRLADGLDRSHAEVVEDLRCKPGGKRGPVRCRLDVRADAALEVWGADRKAELFERTFGRPIEFEVAD